MVVYVAFIAILNLALGYALAVYLGAGRGRPLRASFNSDDESFAGDYDENEYESDDSYEDAAEADEYESAVN